MNRVSTWLLLISVQFALLEIRSCYSQDPIPPYERLLKSDSLARANELQAKIDHDVDDDNLTQAIEIAKELLELRIKAQGADHYEVTYCKFSIEAMNKVASQSPEKREQWRLFRRQDQEAKQLEGAARYSQALAIRQQILELHRSVLGDDHPDTAASYSNVVGNLYAMGKVAEALPLAQKALAIDQNVLGENDPITARSYNNVAMMLSGLGKLTEAQDLLRKSLEIRRSAVGEKHPDFALSCNNLAMNLHALGKSSDAEPMQRKALEIQREVYGEEHPATARSYNNLAVILDAQGKRSETTSLHRKALELRRKLYGPEHPETAASYNNLAANLNSQGQFSKAEPYLLKALEVYKKLLGDEHPSTAYCYQNLAANLQAQAKAIEAEPLYVKSLAIRRKALGEDHPDTAEAYNGVARNLQVQGRASEAEHYLKTALDIRRRVLGEEHPSTAASYNNLATNLDAQGKFYEATSLYRKSLSIYLKLHGETHPDSAHLLNNLAANLSELKAFTEAEPLYRKSLNIRQKILGEEHPDSASSYNNLAACLSSMGKAKEASELFDKALKIRIKVMGDNNPDTANSYSNVGQNLRILGNSVESRKHLQKALDIRRQVLGEAHPETAASYHNLAMDLMQDGDMALAEALLKRELYSFESSRLRNAQGIDRAILKEIDPRMMIAIIEQSRTPDLAWHTLETSLARGLLDEQGKEKERMTSDEKAEYSDLQGRFAKIQPEIRYLATRSNRSSEEEARLEELLSDRRQVDEQLASLAINASTREVATAQEIRASIPKDAAMVLWLDLANRSGSFQQHWVCVVRNQGPIKWVSLAGSGESGVWTPEDQGLTGQLRKELRSRNTPVQEIKKLVEKLRHQRLLPIANELKDVKKLYVVPVHEMSGIPLEILAPEHQVEYVTSGTALARARNKPELSEVKTLLAIGDPVFKSIEVRREEPLPPSGILVVSVLPGGAAEKDVRPGDVLLTYGDTELKDLDSLSKVIASSAQSKDSKRIPMKVWRIEEDGNANTITINLAPGRLGANLSKQPAREAIIARRHAEALIASSSRSGRIDAKTGEKLPWKELPGAAIELEQLRNLFGDQGSFFTRSQASEQTLAELRNSDQLKKYRFLHFATHGLANDSLAFESFLVLAQDELPKALPNTGKNPINGELTAREVMKDWKLDAELVTLSACESALGRPGGSDGMLGFAQAFLVSGSRSVCLSLWEVDDNATALLMGRFYQNLLGKREGLQKPMKKGAALREAKSWLRNLTSEEALKLSAEITKSVTRGKDEKLPSVVEPKSELSPSKPDAKPYEDPRFWSAFILIGDPD